MNAPNEKQLRLEEGVGTWIGEEQMLPSKYMPVGRTAQARSEARMCAAGRIRVSDYTQSVDGNVTMQGHAVTVWNPSENCYVMYWFDAGGSPPTEFKGDYEGEFFALKGSVPGGGANRRTQISAPRPAAPPTTESQVGVQSAFKAFKAGLQ